MWSGKHAPCRLSHLLRSQTDQIEQLRDAGFVLHPELFYENAGGGSVIVHGYIRCAGGLYLQVKQRISPAASGRGLHEVSYYSYSGILDNRGTIFRYDPPHPDHNCEHHVHEFARIGDAATESVRFLYSEAEIPTLPDALRRLYDWYLDHMPGSLDI